MPTSKELVAYNRTEKEVAEEIGADSVIYQRLEDLISSVSKFNPKLSGLDVSVFNGRYVTGESLE